MILAPTTVLAALLMGCGEPTAPSILVVSFDTLRVDRVGAYGSDAGLTPNLDRFAGEAVLFERAYSQAGSTTPSHGAILTSRYPAELFADPHSPGIGDVPTLPEVLGHYGYQTAAVVAGGDLAPEVGLDKGFGTYESPENFGSFFHTVPLALDWLDGRDRSQPFFALVHGYDAHTYLKPTPWGYPDGGAEAEGPGQVALRTSVQRIQYGRLLPDQALLGYVSKAVLRPGGPEGRALWDAELARLDPQPPVLDEDDLALVRSAYDGAISYADTWFGLLMAGLAERDLLDDTIVVVLSDHGEQLAEDGSVFHHCCAVDENIAHSMLMVRMPGGSEGGRRVSGMVELIDLMPTLLEQAGATLPSGARGRSLGPALAGQRFEARPVAFTQGGHGLRSLSVTEPGGRLTYTGPPVSEQALPALMRAASLSGPSFEVAEGTSVASAERLRDALVAWVEALPRQVEGRRPALSPELRKSMRDNGYWEVEEP